MGKLIDLHTHTFYSDGVLSPAELVKKAKEKNLAAIAVTDHDTVEGLKEAVLSGQKNGLEVVPGVEITSYQDENSEFHFLGYFIDWQNKKLIKILRDFSIDRENRAKKIIRNLNELGYMINFGDLKSIVRGTIVLPHIAWLVINDNQNRSKLKREFGKIPSIGDFIVKFLVPGAAAYETRKTIKPKEAISLIHEFSGLVSLAHPCWNLAKTVDGKLSFSVDFINDLVSWGLDALEVYAHRDNEQDTRVCVEFFSTIAKEKGLLMTGGSDFHGFGSAGKDLGFSDFYLKVGYDILEGLKERRK